MHPLAIDETSPAIEVDPRCLYHPSDIEITPNARYRFAASGKWKDSWITCGPDGWWGWLLQKKNRLPGRRVFLLCGVVGKDEKHAFPIGSACEWNAPPEVAGCSDPQLYFFANDWSNKYGNNHPLGPEKGGPLRVVITRLA